VGVGGWGYLLRGAGGKSFFKSHADSQTGLLSQLFVGEIPFFFRPLRIFVSDPRFAREMRLNSISMTQEHRRAAAGLRSWLLRFMALSLTQEGITMESASTARAHGRIDSTSQPSPIASVMVSLPASSSFPQQRAP